MTSRAHQWTAFALALAGAVAVTAFSAHAGNRRHREEGRLGTIFVIAMENHNWTQPSDQTNPQQIFMNPNAPFVNSLVNGTSGFSDQVSYATNYINSGVGVHPSEPNYIWAEAGTNFGVANDNDPYTGGTNQNPALHLSPLLSKVGKHWK